MRKYNFYAGPSTLPVEVLEELKGELVDYNGEGLSMIETSHRSPMYDAVHTETVALFRELLRIPEHYKVLFVGGGATLQFGMVPLNLLTAGRTADYTLSGAWAKKAFGDAKKVGAARLIWDGSEDGFTTLPDAAQITVPADSAYVHLTSNETIGGVQWKSFPKTGPIPLVADMSSDILSRPLNIEDFGIIYAGAQKNIGPSGVTVVVIREDVAEGSNENLPAYLRYKTHADKGSLYNTPPVFSIYAVNKVLKWLKGKGGVEGIQKLNAEKSSALYGAIDGSGGFYTCPVDKAVRSDMNVVFRLPTEELEKEFIAEAKSRDMLGLKGHRDVGGCRASIYNAVSLAGVEVLTAFMDEFARTRG
ncbi:MAG: 3-phosphoserine/phosphohydroxythreonine transaminase [Spirochaetales bacterium]|nr:3-phosphoserine/phosphohydroxythreonine transaminase [Spirochaetales bacterium]